MWVGTRETKYFDNKEDAQIWAARAEKELKNQQVVKLVEKKSIEELSELYLKSLADTTISHKRDVSRSLSDSFAALKIKTFDQLDVRMVRRLHHQEGLTPRTVNKKLGYMKAMARFLHREAWIDKNPLEFLEKVKDNRNIEKRALNRAETEELLRVVYRNSPQVMFPIVFTALRLALRKGEVLTLRWQDIDFEHNQLKIVDKPDVKFGLEPFKCKWGSSRNLPLYPELKKLFLGLEKISQFVFPLKNGGLRYNNFNRSFAKAIDGAKIERLDEVTPHTMRHTRISQLIAYDKRNPKEAQVFAGHKSLSTTIGYTHLLGGMENMMSSDTSLPGLDEIYQCDSFENNFKKAL